MANWCGHEMTKEEYESCDRAWGGSEDLACQFEIEWEERFGKSAWYWKDVECKGQVSKDYESRPMEYSTFGYTDDYEDWGQNAVVLAVLNFGLRDSEDIGEFLGKLLEIRLTSRK